jgi:hypothetical protein
MRCDADGAERTGRSGQGGREYSTIYGIQTVTTIRNLACRLHFPLYPSPVSRHHRYPVFGRKSHFTSCYLYTYMYVYCTYPTPRGLREHHRPPTADHRQELPTSSTHPTSNLRSLSCDLPPLPPYNVFYLKYRMYIRTINILLLQHNTQHDETTHHMVITANPNHNVFSTLPCPTPTLSATRNTNDLLIPSQNKRIPKPPQKSSTPIVYRFACVPCPSVSQF